MKIIFIHGFCGSGKTTLANKIISDYPRERIVYVANELNEAQVDKALLSDKKVPYYLANNGKLLGCKNDEAFLELLNDLLDSNYEYVLVETSGFDDPSTLSANMNEVVASSEKKIAYYNVTVVDGVYYPLLVDKYIILKRHVQIADLVLLNKADLLTAKETKQLTGQLKRITKAPIITSEYCQCDLLFSQLKNSKKPTLYGQRKRNLDLRSISIDVKPWITQAQLNDFFTQIKEMVYRAKGIIQINGGRMSCQLASKQLAFDESTSEVTPLVLQYSSSDILENEIMAIYKKIVCE